MEVFREIKGNLHSRDWREQASASKIEYIDLEEWQAQRSRMLVRSDRGREYAIALKRPPPIKDGDILHADRRHIVAIRLRLSQIMILDLSDALQLPPPEILSLAVEIGHALGNQHWAAVVKGDKIYVPLTVDRKVMQSVMQTHHFPHMSYTFSSAEELLPQLSPSEVRRLLGSTEHHHSHD